jgi:hypothetical protein
VGGALLLSGVITDSLENKLTEIILSHLNIEISPGTGNGFEFTAACRDDAKLVGGLCMITSGYGVLQNAGISSDARNYICTYSPRADSNGVKAAVYAACLKRR